MPAYIKYELEDGSTFLVEGEAVGSNLVKASQGVNVVEASQKFTDALASIRGSLKALIHEMDAMAVEEAEVKFGLKAVGEAGLIAVGKVGGEVNYEVILRWKKPEERSKRTRKT